MGDDWNLRNDNPCISIADIPIVEKLRQKLIEDIDNMEHEFDGEFSMTEPSMDKFFDNYFKFTKEAFKGIINRRFGNE